MNARDVPIPSAPDSDAPLFVYGTLRRGGPAEAMLANCRFLGEAQISGSLYHLGRYPALVLDGRGVVHGELWMCSTETLSRLDTYEGVGHGLFHRVTVRAGERECWTYVAGPQLRPRLEPERRIAGGRWEAAG